MFKILKSRKFLTIFPIILIAIILLSGYFTLQRMFKKTSLWRVPQAGGVLPLIADSEHDVVVLEECDLAVRFKKTFKIEKDNNRGDEYFYLTNDYGDLLYISCSGAKIKGLSNRREFKDNDKFLTPSVKTLLNKNIDFSLSTNGVNSNECTGLAYNFQQNGKKYEIIDQIAPKPFTCAIDAFFVNGKNNFFTELFGKYGQDYIQIQFNSLAPSVPSVKLTETVSSSTVSDSASIVSKGSANISANISNNYSVSNTKSLVADSEHDVVVLEECGLTIKIDKKLNLKTYENYAGSKTRLDFLDKDFHGAGAHYVFQTTVDCDNRFTKEQVIDMGKKENSLSDPVTEIDVNNWTIINQSSKKMIKKVQKLKVDRSNDYSGQIKYNFFVVEKLDGSYFTLIFHTELLENGFQFQLN